MSTTSALKSVPSSVPAGRSGTGASGDRLGGVTGRISVLVLGVLLLCATGYWSLFVGAGQLTSQQVLQALLHPAEAAPDTVTIVREMRLTRTVTALLVGLALGIAGQVMQSLIENPLADPGLLGVNAGAAFGVVIAVGVLGLVSFEAYVPYALLGALIVSLFVYAVSLTVGRGSPFTIVLSGVAITAVLTGITTALAVLDSARFNVLRGWMSGNVAGRDADVITVGAWIILLGVLLTVCVARPLGQLSLGDDLARSLGVRTGRTRLVAACAVMLLAGGGTALGGPIMFVGLMVPHVARALVGPRIGWALAYSALSGGLLLLGADMVGRILIPPGEAPAGLITAILGAPVLALLARRSGERS